MYLYSLFFYYQTFESIAKKHKKCPHLLHVCASVYFMQKHVTVCSYKSIKGKDDLLKHGHRPKLTGSNNQVQHDEENHNKNIKMVNAFTSC